MGGGTSKPSKAEIRKFGTPLSESAKRQEFPDSDHGARPAGRIHASQLQTLEGVVQGSGRASRVIPEPSVTSLSEPQILKPGAP